jgi:hypothetical protein
MKEGKKDMMAAGTRIGAVAGIILFVVFGLVPGAYLGSYAALAVLAGVTGGPVEPTLIMRVLIVVGALLGVGVSAVVGIVGGALAGTGLGYAADALFGHKKAEDVKEEGAR